VSDDVFGAVPVVAGSVSGAVSAVVSAALDAATDSVAGAVAVADDAGAALVVAGVDASEPHAPTRSTPAETTAHPR
jgi:hypothetical protein